MAIVLLVAATVLTALGHMSIAEWREFSTYIFGIYVGGNAIQGVGESIAKSKIPPSTVSTTTVTDPQVGTSTSTTTNTTKPDPAASAR